MEPKPKRSTRGLRVEYMALSELEKWPRNPKTHDIPGLKKSIRRFGFTLPVMVDEKTGRLVAGHGRQEALSEMKAQDEPPPGNIKRKGDEWMIPVVRGNSFSSEAEAERYLIADNRFVELGGWDNQALLAMLEGQEEVDLSDIGFNAGEVERLVTVREHERRWQTVDQVLDPNGEWDGMPEFNQQDKTAFRSIQLHFKTEEDVQLFENLIGRPLPKKARYLWYPEIEIESLVDKRYTSDES